MLDLTVASIPVYFGTMAAEHRYLKKQAAETGPTAGDYTPADTATTIADRIVARVPQDQHADQPPATASRRRMARLAAKASRVAAPVAAATGTLAASTFLASRTNPDAMWEKGKQHDRGDGAAAWAAAIAGWDFLYYWNHRLMHEVRGMWALHVVHHSSERYNLSTALRQSVAEVLGVWVPYGMLARASINPYLLLQPGRGRLPRVPRHPP